MNNSLSHSSLAELQHLIATHADQKAYSELFKRFAPSLIRFSVNWVKDEQVAEELVSDVFVRIWERRNTLDQVQNLRMYLFVSIRNFSINYLKSKRPLVATDFSQDTEDIEGAKHDTPYHILYSRQLDAHMYEALGHLPPRCRTIFTLAKEDGLKVKEIAELMHVSPKTVENQITIAFKRLAGFLQPLKQKIVKLRS